MKSKITNDKEVTTEDDNNQAKIQSSPSLSLDANVNKWATINSHFI